MSSPNVRAGEHHVSRAMHPVLMLPRSVLISPLWARKRNGMREIHIIDGNVFVLGTGECTMARALTMLLSAKSGKYGWICSAISWPL